jgi:hypothetical protein
MLNIKVKEKKDFYDVNIKGRNTDILQAFAMLDGIIGYMKREFDLSVKDIMTMLYDFKKMTKEEE